MTTNAPFPPVPPDPDIRARERCSICKNKVRKAVIDVALENGLSDHAISTAMKATGWPIGPVAVARHRRHYIGKPTKGLKGRDLAIVVRDKTIEAIDDGRLDIESDNWKNVAPGLRAQDALDRRANKTDDRKALMAFASMLLGGGREVPDDALALDDGLTIDGDYEEVE